MCDHFSFLVLIEKKEAFAELVKTGRLSPVTV